MRGVDSVVKLSNWRLNFILNLNLESYKPTDDVRNLFSKKVKSQTSSEDGRLVVPEPAAA